MFLGSVSSLENRRAEVSRDLLFYRVLLLPLVENNQGGVNQNGFPENRQFPESGQARARMKPVEIPIVRRLHYAMACISFPQF